MKKRKDGRYCKTAVINGTRKFFYSSATSERAAEKDIYKQIEEAENAISDKRENFGNIAEQYRTEMYENVEPLTRQRYNSFINRAIDYFGKCKIDDIRRKDIGDMLDDMANQNFSKKTIAGQKSILNQIFKFAIRNEYTEQLPTEYVPIPKKAKPQVKREAITEEEQKIINKNIDKPFGLFVYFLLYTGLRLGEAVTLKYSDIDFEKGIIAVSKTADWSVFPTGIKNHTKTDAGMRTAILPNNAAALLPRGKKNDYVFGEPRSESYYLRNMRRYCDTTGIKVTMHQLRHTYATMLFEAGIDDKSAQTIMGHADYTTTKNIYTHLREQKQQQAKTDINNYFSKNFDT